MNDIASLEGKPHCHCGVFGIYGHTEASTLCYYGLHALQHRGQEAAGIVSKEWNTAKAKWQFNIYRGVGLGTEVFKEESVFKNILKSNSAIVVNQPLVLLKIS